MTEPTRRPTSPAFPLTTGRAKGYQRKAVDSFLRQARASFEGTAGDATLTAADVRSASFPLVRNGYAVASVDAALGRVEDAFAARVRGAAISELGRASWVTRSRETAQGILDQIDGSAGKKFRRRLWPKRGYRVDEVDIVMQKIARYLADGRPIGIDQVRSVGFRTQRGGYREAQVDAVLDAVIDLMLAVD